MPNKFLYDTTTLEVAASALDLAVSPMPAGCAIVVLDAPLTGYREKKVNQHPNPTSLIDNPKFGQHMSLTLNGVQSDPLDGVPYGLANGVAQVTVELQKLDRANQPLTGAGDNETLRIVTLGVCAPDVDEIQLVNGHATIHVGPTVSKGDCQLKFCDLSKSMTDLRQQLRWR